MAASSRHRTLFRAVALLVLLAGGALLTPWGRLADWWIPPPESRDIYQAGLAAMIDQDMGRVQSAAEALSSPPTDVPYAHVLEGYVHLKGGRLGAAVTELARAREHPETAAMANLLAGEALYRNRQIPDAIEALSTAAELDASLTDAHRRLAAIYYDLGASEAAIRELQTVSRQAPDDPRPHRLLGAIHKDRESFAQAIPEYQEALRRDAEMDEREGVLLELAECQLKAQRLDDLHKTLQLCSPSAAAHARRAQLLMSAGKMEEARREADRALGMDANHLEALLALATLDMAAGDLDRAIDVLRRAVDQHPSDFTVHHRLSMAYAERGEKELAEQHARETARLRELRAQFAELHARAAQDLRDANLRYELGCVARELGRLDLAISWFTAALSLDPHHSAARQALQAPPSPP